MPTGEANRFGHLRLLLEYEAEIVSRADDDRRDISDDWIGKESSCIGFESR